ncbi:MAG: hypothetical protein N3B18_13110, partial [Desulfobacterota bacterium]|nr:hypothetical protein [Thermodesulfobacteriota bacterium]
MGLLTLRRSMPARLCTVVLFVCMVCCPGSGQAIVTHLTTGDIEAARRYGAEHGRQTDALLETLYGCGEQGPAGYTVVVRTKWHKLALLASRKALAGNA